MYFSESQVVGGLNACMCETILDTSLSAVVPLLTDQNTPAKLQHAAAHALNAVCMQKTQYRCLDQLFTLFTTDLSHLPKQVLFSV